MCAVTPMTAGPVSASTPVNTPVSGSVLDNTVAPAGTNVTVDSFKVPGSDTPIKPGSAPVPLVDPATGTVTGTIAIQPDGSYTFTPAPGYAGPVPPVLVTVVGSDGQAKQTQLNLTVNPVLTDANEDRTITQGSGPLTLNLLDNAKPPPGTTVNITSFQLPGSSTVYPAGPNPVPVIDPITGANTGTIVVRPDGTATFTPAAGFTGQAPPIAYTVASSDGQTSPGTLTVTVAPSE